MITGEGLIGKMVWFVIDKVTGKKLDLALDERRRACRAFTELYFCVVKLEDVTDLFVASLDEAIERNNTIDLVNLIFSQNGTLESLSRRLLDISSDLYRAIELIDPPLARTLGVLFSFKYSFLEFIRNSICLKTESRNHILEYKEPHEKTLEIDLESVYKWEQSHSEDDDVRPEGLVWPTGPLLDYEFDSFYRYKTIQVSDIQELQRLRDIVVLHMENLSLAREALRKFVSEQFAVEEILYVSKGTERYQF